MGWGGSYGCYPFQYIPGHPLTGTDTEQTHAAHRTHPHKRNPNWHACEHTQTHPATHTSARTNVKDQNVRVTERRPEVWTAWTAKRT